SVIRFGSDASRIGFRKISFLSRPSFERLERGGLVDVNHRIELIHKPRAEIVAEALRLRPVNDANRPFQTFFGERRANLRPIEHQQHAVAVQIMKEPLVAPRERWPNLPLLGGIAPVAGGGDRSGVCRETDRKRLIAMTLPHELTEIQFAASAHFGCARVAEMR